MTPVCPVGLTHVCASASLGERIKTEAKRSNRRSIKKSPNQYTTNYPIITG
jgi:hypothetical protein